MKDRTLEKLLEERVVVIIRVADPDDIPPIVACLVEGGIRAVEITSNTPGCMAAVTRLRVES